MIFVPNLKIRNSNEKAAKLLRCERASEKLRVRDEIDILRRLDHPNVLRLVAAHEDEDTFIQGEKEISLKFELPLRNVFN